MPITSQNIFALTTIQHLVIDCKAIETQPQMKQELSNLLGWMKSQPRKGNLHVTLRFATANATGRRLKAVLQACGCTVTMKTFY